MPGKPKPIRYDEDTWLVMRSDPVLPKAVVQRVHQPSGGDRYLVFRWDLEPGKRRLMRVVDSLEAANELVKFDNVMPTERDGPPNGRLPDGSWWSPPQNSPGVSGMR